MEIAEADGSCGYGLLTGRVSRLAKAYACISYREAEAVFTKYRFWRLRAREITYKDEARQAE